MFLAYEDIFSHLRQHMLRFWGLCSLIWQILACVTSFINGLIFETMREVRNFSPTKAESITRRKLSEKVLPAKKYSLSSFSRIDVWASVPHTKTNCYKNSFCRICLFRIQKAFWELVWPTLSFHFKFWCIFVISDLRNH